LFFFFLVSWKKVSLFKKWINKRLILLKRSTFQCSWLFRNSL
jgi:hypothetical protein